MKILVTIPVCQAKGGVTSYYNIIGKHFSADINYFTVGARLSNEGKWQSLRRLVRNSWDFYKTLNKSHYDIIHLNPSLGFKAVIRDGILLIIAKSLDKKVIVFFHGWDHTCQRIIQRYFLTLFKIIFSQADAFVVLSCEFKGSLQSMGIHKPIYLRTTAVADELIHQTDRGLPIQKIKNMERRFNILFLARMERAKGIYEAIDAFKILQTKYPFVTLTIAGDGTELVGAKQYVRSQGLKDVNFLGHVTGKAKEYALTNADVYLFPSHTEGMPISVLEAMACGRPVVTRAVGALNDFFVNGQMGFVTDSKEPQVFAELIEKLIRDESLCYKIRNYNRRYAEKNFLASKVTEDIQKIYTEVLANVANL